MDATSVKVTAAVLSVTATLAVGGRFQSRKLKKQRYCLDDWTVLASLVIMWGMTSVIIAGSLIGLYDNHENATAAHYERIMQLQSKFNFAKCILLISGLGLVKLSVVFLYRRIFGIIHPFYIYTIILTVLLATHTIGFLLTSIFQCGTQVWARWAIGPEAADRFCKAAKPGSYGFMVSDIITHFIVLVSPVPVIWNMCVSTGRKLGITGAFGLGLLSTGAAFGHLNTFLGAIHGTKAAWQMECEMAIWGIVEVSVAVVAACLPVMGPLFQCQGLRCFFSSVRSSSIRSRQKDDSSWIEINPV